MIQTALNADGLLPLAEHYALDVMASRASDEIIRRGAADDPFFKRWWLVRKGAGEIENLYLHNFLRSDREERHDHPWDNGSLVIRGSYVEDTPEGRFTRRAGDIVLRHAEQLHAIVDVEPGTLTLFATLRKQREWGFVSDEGQWIHHGLFREWKHWSGMPLPMRVGGR